MQNSLKGRKEESRELVPPASASALTAVLQGISDGVMILDDAWRCTFVNEAAAAFLKTTPAEILGKVIWEAFPHLKNTRFHKDFLHAAAEKTFVRVEDYYEPKRRWYECRCHPTENGLAVFLCDTTGHKKIEEAMLESRQVLEMAITGSNAGIWRIDLTPERPGCRTDYMYLSPQLKALIGFESEEFPNSQSAWLDRVLSEDRARLEEARKAHAEGRIETYQVDFRIRHKDGGIRWLARRGRLYRDEFNRPIRWAGVDTDITDRMLAGEAQQENEERLRHALEAGRVFTFEWRPATDEVLRSPNSASILGWTGDATHDTGQSFFARIHPEDREAFVRLTSTLSPDRPAYETTYRYVRREDGREVVLEESGRAAFDESGTMVCLRGLTRDVTERKRAEDALRRRTEEIERLMDVLPVGVAVADDPQCRRIRVNQTNAEMLGIPAERNASLSAPQEQTPGYRVLRDGRECPAEELPMQVAASEGRPVLNEEYDVARPDGNVTSVLMSAVPLRNERGEPRGAVGAIVDITERKRAEQAIGRLQKQAERAAEHARWLARIPEENANPVLRISDDCVLLYSNPAAERLCEYWSCWLGHKVPLVVQEIILDALAAGTVRNREILCGGRTFWLAVAPCPADGYVNIHARDITERKQMEQSLQQTNELLQAQAEELQTQAEELHAQAEELRESERALREAHARAAWLARFPQENPNPVLRVSADGNVLYCNPAAARLPGWMCEVGQPLPQAVLRHLVGKAMAHGETMEQDVELDGAYYAVGVLPIQAECYANIYGRDITEQRHAQESLRRSEEIARQRLIEIENLYRNAPVGLCVMDAELRWVRINERMARTNGFSVAEHLGKRVRDLIPRLADAVEAPMRRVLETGEPMLDLEVTDETAGPGLRRTWLASWLPIKDADGKVVGINVVADDISERKRAEMALHQSEENARQRAEELAALMDMTPTAVWVSADPQCRVIIGNRAAKRFYEAAGDENLSAGAAGGEQDFTRRFFQNGRELRPEELPMQEAAIKGVDVRNSELDVLLPSGRTITILGNASPLFDAQGTVRGSIGAFVDITDRKKHERMLRESEERLRTVLDHMPVGVWFTDKDGCIVYGNEAGQKIWAGAKYVGPDQFSEYKAWWWPSGEPIEPQNWAVVRAVRDGQTSLNERIEIQCFDGTRKIIHNSAAPIRDEAGDILGAVILNEDITSHVRAEQGLRESEQRLRMALEGGRMGLWEWDIENDRSYWDERVDELLGPNQGRPAGYQEFLQHVDARDIESLKATIKTSLDEGSDFEAEFRLTRPSGEAVWAALQSKVIRDASGKTVRMLGVLFDITQRRQMEEQLRGLNDQLEEEVQAQTEELRDTIDRLQDEVVRRVLAEGKLRKSAQMLEGFFQHTITPLAFMDRQFNFVQVNEAYARAEGRNPEFFKGKNHFALYPHPENQAIFEQVVRTGKPYRVFAKPLEHTGDPTRATLWDWQLTPLRNDRGEVQYLVLNLRDVTRQQAALRELEHRAFQLQKLTLELCQAEDRERRRMAEVLHDGLQQQLAAAKFHLGLLSSRAKQDPTMCEITAQLDQMLRDAIEQSRSLSHDLSPAILYQSDLGETFEWLARQIQTKHGFTVHTEVHGRVDTQSESIKAFLFRTGREILFNAVKHAKVAEARLRLQRRRNELWLTIADRGRGFEPATLGRTAGFGLLSIRERVGLLGGRMKIRSIPSRGSIFVIAVPEARVAEETPQTAGARREAAGPVPVSGLRPPASGARLRVLLVDDHKVMREGLAALIGEQSDMEIVGQAGDGAEAVEQARELQPDVVIMDMAMPVMPGDEATRRIKAELPRTRVVALSMFAEPGVREKMLDAGAEIYLPKTGPSEELLAAIRGLDL